MKTLFHLLILILIVSYGELPSLLSVEARKLNWNGGIFTVDLIHRDRLLSQSQSHQENEKNDITSEMTPSGGGYLMKIAIGSPPFEFMAFADTGSDLIWLQCQPCVKAKACIPQQSPLFDPTKSSTYQPIDCKSPSCSNSDLTTFCAKNNTNTDGGCLYDVLYGDGTISIGALSTDTITFPSSVTLPSSVFGCGFFQTGSLPNGDGIIGLGTGPSSLVSQLGPKINYKFSYCLAPLSSGATSKLTFGADVSSQVSTPYVTKTGYHHYFLVLDGVSIGTSMVQSSHDVIIDSGTTLTFLEASVYSGIKEALKSAIALSPMQNPDGGQQLCYETQESLNPPDVVFRFKGAEVVLKELNLFRKYGTKTCLAMLPTNGSIFIFGNVAQVNFVVGYDLQAKQVSFVPTDCTTY